MKQIDIHYFTRTEGEKKVIPVLYDVEERQDQGMQIMRCRIGLPENELPAWLNPEQFNLITHTRDGMQIIDYGTYQNPELRTIDADFFRYKVYSEIVFRERKYLSDGWQC